MSILNVLDSADSHALVESAVETLLAEIAPVQSWTPADLVSALNRAGYALVAQTIAPRGGVTAATFLVEGVLVIFYADMSGFLTQLGHVLLGHTPTAVPANRGRYAYTTEQRHEAMRFVSSVMQAAGTSLREPEPNH